MTLNDHFVLNSVLRWYVWSSEKHGLRGFATLKLVVNVVGELTKKNIAGITRFRCDSTALLFYK